MKRQALLSAETITLKTLALLIGFIFLQEIMVLLEHQMRYPMVTELLGSTGMSWHHWRGDFVNSYTD